MSEEGDTYEDINTINKRKTRSQEGEILGGLEGTEKSRKRKTSTVDKSRFETRPEPPDKKIVIDITPVGPLGPPSSLPPPLLPTPLLEFREPENIPSASSSESSEDTYDSVGPVEDLGKVEISKQKRQEREVSILEELAQAMATAGINGEEEDRMLSGNLPGTLPMDLQNWTMDLNHTYQIPPEIMNNAEKRKQLEELLGPDYAAKMNSDWVARMEIDKKAQIDAAKATAEQALKSYKDLVQTTSQEVIEILDEATGLPQREIGPETGAISKRSRMGEPQSGPSILKNGPSLADGFRKQPPPWRFQFKDTPDTPGFSRFRREAGSRARSEESERSSASGFRSSASSLGGAGQEGLHNLMSHMTKPISVLLDVNQRNNPEAIERSNQHLNKIRPSAVQIALKSEQIIREQSTKLDVLMQQMNMLSDEFGKLKFESQVSRHAITDKIGKLRANPDYTYPGENNRCSDENWVKAVKSMEANFKNLEKTLSFNDNVYNFALQLSSYSNIIAANYGLSKEQQKKLVLTFIPTMSALYNDLSMTSSLEKMFDQISTNCDLLCTKPEMEAKINNWQLDCSSWKGITHSVLHLKDLFILYENRPVNQINIRDLYEKVFTRIRKEKLTIAVGKKVDEARILMANCTDMVDFHDLIVSSLKDMIYTYKRPQLPQQHHNGPKVNEITMQKQQQLALTYEKGMDSVRHSPPPQSQPQSEKKSKNKKGKAVVNAVDTEPIKPAPKAQGQKEQKKKGFFVKQWPDQKNYLNKSGNNLTRDCNEHFKGHCHKCGHSSHESTTCRIYPEKDAVLTLCSTCLCGFHTVCKNWKYVGKPDRPRNRNTNNTDDKNQKAQVNLLQNKLEDVESMIRIWARGGAGHEMGSYYPYPPPPPDLPANFKRRHELPSSAALPIIDIGGENENSN